jgi:hypothetical protein
LGDKDKLVKAIFESSLLHAANSNNLTEEEIRRVPLGKRRKLHDDMTIVVVDLDK